MEKCCIVGKKKTAYIKELESDRQKDDECGDGSDVIK
jgi:hypothetical protein